MRPVCYAHILKISNLYRKLRTDAHPFIFFTLRSKQLSTTQEVAEHHAFLGTLISLSKHQLLRLQERPSPCKQISLQCPLQTKQLWKPLFCSQLCQETAKSNQQCELSKAALSCRLLAAGARGGGESESSPNCSAVAHIYKSATSNNAFTRVQFL